eukprot:gene2343-2564_t
MMRKRMNHPHSPNRFNLTSFVYGIFSTLVVFCIIYTVQNLSSAGLSSTEKTDSSDSSIPIPIEPFPEPPWRTPNTLEVRTVTSTPFARFEIHKVRTENGAIVNDWLWTDERAHVNILVHLKKEDRYLMFYQGKYGLSQKKYATVGGLFNAGDTPLSCARRELLEETGLESPELIYLGAYRVQVNRGGGILHAFYARNAVPSRSWRPSDDYEKLEKRLLTKQELVNVTLSGEVGEAQWLATVSTALIYEDYMLGRRVKN